MHEAGHQLWYGMVGNNEFEDAWMDEGINTFATARAHRPRTTRRTYLGAAVFRRLRSLWCSGHRDAAAKPTGIG